MPPQESFRIVPLGGSAPQAADFFDFQVSEYPMMAVLAVAGCEQAEEKKYVTDADAIPLQMGLGRARLSERPTPIQEHRVFMAEMVATKEPSGRVLDDISEPCEAVACLRTSLRWDWKTNRLPVDDRRGNPSGGAIEAFSAKDYSHGRFCSRVVKYGN